MNLFTTYYQPKSPERKAEYEFCILKNKFSFDKIYLFVEPKDADAASQFGVQLVVVPNRPTFRNYFEYISLPLFSETINVIANTDIFLLNDLQIMQNIHRLQKGKTCFALTRYDFHFNRPSDLFDRPDSQDTWIFNGNEGLDKVEYAEFSLGQAGCDNRIAHELVIAGFDVLNPSRTIQTFHLHETEERSYLEGEIQRVPPPYFLLPPTY